MWYNSFYSSEQLSLKKDKNSVILIMLKLKKSTLNIKNLLVKMLNLRTFILCEIKHLELKLKLENDFLPSCNIVISKLLSL